MRVALAVLALAVLAGCPDPRPPGGAATGAATTTVSIYRDGDDRVAGEPRTVYRIDGNVVALAAAPVGEPRAVITTRREVELRAGEQTLALPEIAASAAPGSIWLRRIAGPGRLDVRRITRPPSFTDATSLRGRAVVAILGGKRIAGTLVDLDERGALLDRDGTLIAVGKARLELADPSAVTDEPITAEVVAGRAGRYLIEIAYRTGALDWDLDLELEVSTPGLTGPAAVTTTPVVAIDSRGVAVDGAEIALFEGRLAADGQRPRLVWRGRGDITAGRSHRRLEPRTLEGAVEYRYRGFLGDRPTGRDHLRWGTGAMDLVELVLRLPPGSLPPAPAIARIEIASAGSRRSHEVAIAEPAAGAEPVELVLGTAETLRGSRRQLWVKLSDGGRLLTESYRLAVTNLGAETATVRVREPLARADDVELLERPEGAEIVAGALEHTLVVAGNSQQAFEIVARYRMQR